MKSCFLSFLLLLYFTPLKSQVCFNKIFKLRTDTAQGIFNVHFYKDTFYMNIGYSKNGFQSGGYAVLDTNMTCVRHDYYPFYLTNTLYTQATKRNYMYKSMVVVDQDYNLLDTTLIRRVDVQQNKILDKKVKQLYRSSVINKLASDGISIFGDTLYVYSNRSKELSKYRIDLYTPDLDFINTVYVNNPKLADITRIIADEKYIYMVGMTDTVINESYAIVHYITKMDKNFNKIWEHCFEHQSFRFLPVNVALDGDELIVTGYTDSKVTDHQANQFFPIVFRLDAQGKILWQHEFRNPYNSGFLDITILKNSDILLAGFKSTKESEGDAGWLVRLNRNGEILWDRQYSDRQDLEFHFSEFNKTFENIDGYIYAFGLCLKTYKEGENTKVYSHLWAVKLGADGCPGFECGELVKDYVLSNYGAIEHKQIQVFPNPVNDIVYISGNEKWTKGKFKVFDSTGREVHTAKIESQLTTLNVASYSSGIYFILFENTGAIAKFIKL